MAAKSPMSALSPRLADLMNEWRLSGSSADWSNVRKEGAMPNGRSCGNQPGGFWAGFCQSAIECHDARSRHPFGDPLVPVRLRRRAFRLASPRPEADLRLCERVGPLQRVKVAFEWSGSGTFLPSHQKPRSLHSRIRDAPLTHRVPFKRLFPPHLQRFLATRALAPTYDSGP
jgi:hypothetical protein